MTDADRPSVGNHDVHACPHCRAHGLTQADWDNTYPRYRR